MGFLDGLSTEKKQQTANAEIANSKSLNSKSAHDKSTHIIGKSLVFNELRKGDPEGVFFA
jgi:hypothetical protein